MTAEIGEILIAAFAAGVISGVISPIILAGLQHTFIWKSQKKIEVRYSVFQDALKALSLYAADALNTKLQSEKVSYKDKVPETNMRPETVEQLERANGLVKAFFSKEAFDLYDKAAKAEISIENVPNSDFEEKRIKAIIKMSEELGIK